MGRAKMTRRRMIGPGSDAMRSAVCIGGGSAGLDPGAGVVGAGAGIVAREDYDMADEVGDGRRENEMSKLNSAIAMGIRVRCHPSRLHPKAGIFAGHRL